MSKIENFSCPSRGFGLPHGTGSGEDTCRYCGIKLHISVEPPPKIAPEIMTAVEAVLRPLAGRLVFDDHKEPDLVGACGGQYDDAYAIGSRNGETMLARNLCTLLGIAVRIPEDDQDQDQDHEQEQEG
jgi:hypothetical protein